MPTVIERSGSVAATAVSASGTLQLPIYTTAQRNALAAPSEGLALYNSDTDKVDVYTGSSWKETRTSSYDAVVGSAAQVTAGTATHSSVSAAIAANPQGRILVLAGSYAESLTLTSANNNLMLEGMGRGSYINGTLTLNSSATGLNIKWIRWGGNITLSSGCNNTFIRECWQTTGLSISDLGSANSKLIIQE